MGILTRAADRLFGRPLDRVRIRELEGRLDAMAQAVRDWERRHQTAQNGWTFAERKLRDANGARVALAASCVEQATTIDRLRAEVSALESGPPCG